MYRPMSQPGFGAIGAIDNPVDTPSGALPVSIDPNTTIDLSRTLNYMNGQDTAAQIPQASSVDLTSAFYYLTGGTPPSSMQTPSGQNPNVVSTPTNTSDLFGGFLRYVQQNPGTTFLFAILLMLMVGSSPGYSQGRR